MTLADLLAGGTILTDGAWGTQLQAQGLPAGHRPDVWNLTDPARVEKVARSYVEAGSRIILTNTFQANRYALRDHAPDAFAINRAGAEISTSTRAVMGTALSRRGARVGQARARAVRRRHSTSDSSASAMGAPSAGLPPPWLQPQPPGSPATWTSADV